MTRVSDSRRKRRLLERRQGDTCRACQEPMDMRLGEDGNRWGPDAAVIDRIIPEQDGGSGELSNLALAHRRCHQSRRPNPVARGEQRWLPMTWRG